MSSRFKFFRIKPALLFSALIILLPGHLCGQGATMPVSDPNALALASKALQALAGSIALRDITVQATATSSPVPTKKPDLPPSSL